MEFRPLGRLHSNGPIPRTTFNPNAEFSVNDDYVLLDVDNVNVPFMVAIVSRDLPVEFILSRTRLHSAQAATQRITTPQYS